MSNNRASVARKLSQTIIAFELVLLTAFFAALGAVVMLWPETVTLYTGTAMGLVVVWIGLLVPYFAWSIYFFNINLGIPDEDWDDIRRGKEEMIKLGDITPTHYTNEGFREQINAFLSKRGLFIPEGNPFASETMGLPPGTIRGAIALTVTIGGLAMFVATLGMDPSIEVNTLFVDNMEFFKTAFLMVIAFYFGNKSLEALSKSERTSVSGYASNGVYVPPGSTVNPSTGIGTGNFNTPQNLSGDSNRTLEADVTTEDAVFASMRKQAMDDQWGGDSDDDDPEVIIEIPGSGGTEESGNGGNEDSPQESKD